MTIGRPFQPRNPGGPGRPKGSRNKLAEAFLEALHADFQAHGAAAIEAARTESPLGYVRVVASLLPQKLEVNQVAGDLSDDELLAIIRGDSGEDAAPPLPRSSEGLH
jgi:hypothetical protein